MITSEPFGFLPDGRLIELYTLSNGNGMTLKAMTFGGIVTELRVPWEKNKPPVDIVLGFNSLANYLAGHPFFGAITGRVAGRLTAGTFTLDGKIYQLALNDPPNHLHGGVVGFDKRVWHAEIVEDTADSSSVRFTYTSLAGEEGYPGQVEVAVTYTLTGDNQFVVNQEATTTESTPLSLTHHSYFNLAGEGQGTIEDHVLQIFSDQFVPADEAMTLSGKLASVTGQGNDFTSPTKVGDAIPHLWKKHGDTYKIKRQSPDALEPAAKLSLPAMGRVMEVLTTESWIQFYTGVSLDGSLVGKTGVPGKSIGKRLFISSAPCPKSE